MAKKYKTSILSVYDENGNRTPIPAIKGKDGQLKPLFAESKEWLEKNGDTSLVYILPDGFIYSHETTSKPIEAYTNLLSQATDTTGAILNGVGYLEGKRWGSSATTFDDLKDEADSVLVGMLPFKLGQVLRIKNVDTTWTTYTTFRGFTENRTQIVNGYANLVGYPTLQEVTTIDASNNMITVAPPSTANISGGLTSAMCYIAFTVKPISGAENIIVTIDEEIKISTETRSEWVNTGHAFITSENIDGKIVVDGNVEFVNDINECVDTDKLYVLPDGYIYAYISKMTEGELINVVNGYDNDTRLSTSSDTTKGQTDYVATKAIDISEYELPIVFRTQGVNFNDGSYSAFRFYYTDGSTVAGLLSNSTGNTNFYSIEHDADGNMVFTVLNTSNKILSSVKFGGKGKGEDLIITIDGVMSEPTLIEGWNNTGHAFVPADYEDRIVDLESDVSDLKFRSSDFDNRISSLEASENGSVPTYVIAEAKRVANEVLSVRDAYSFVFGAISDIHSTGSDVSTLHAGQGLSEIDKLTTLDACLNFGDGIDNYFENANADSFLHIRKSLHSVQKNIPYIQMQGNHDQLKTDTTEDAQQKYFAYVGANNIGTVTDWDNRFRNYGYRDFPDQRMRVIYLNSVDVSEGENTEDCWFTAMQLSWLINTALDFTNKNGWSFIVGCHHPLNWWNMENLLTILNAYKGKGSGSVTVDGTTVNYNFANATAEFIAHFHGHLHNFRVETLGTNGVLSITIPNACFNRNNEYGTGASYSDEIKANYGDVDENGTQRQYNKISDSEKDTAFNIIVVDRQNEKIHCFNYGAGDDRTITY